MTYPTADEVARAIVAACKFTGDDPIKLAEGWGGLRARYYVFAAINRGFPRIPKDRIGLMLGLNKRASKSIVATLRDPARTLGYWNENDIELVLAAMLPDDRPPAKTPPAPAFGRRYIQPLSPADPTGALMGDPPPGRSALDRRSGA